MAALLHAGRVEIAVWAGLVVATLASWLLAKGAGEGASAATVAVIVVAFVKIHFVATHFMELRTAPLVLRLIVDAYVVVVCVALVVIHLIN